MLSRAHLVTLVSSLVLTSATTTHASDSSRSLILATTTSTRDSGLLDELVPIFESTSGLEVKVIAVGTGAALRMAKRGDADAVLAHAPAAERELVESGDLVEGRFVMFNDFVVIGPADDPAGVRDAATLADVMRAIAANGRFISRGDDSGTHKRELSLWRGADVDVPSIALREETGQGMGATLHIADQRSSYTLCDRGTWLAQRARLRLEVVYAGDPSLRNDYHAYVVNPRRHRRVSATAARAFVAFLVSPETQLQIASFARDRFGESLFHPAVDPRPASGP